MTVETATRQRFETTQTAALIYQEADRVQNLWMGAADRGIGLCRGQVVENDGPGGGRSDDSTIAPFIDLSGATLVRKYLQLDDPRTPGWELVVADYRNFSKGMLDPVALPQASSSSADGGRTWIPERGEYILRLHLDRYHARGELVSAVMDATGQDDDAVKNRRTLQSVQLDWNVEKPEHTRILFHLRSSPLPGADANRWSAWTPCTPGAPVELLAGRYLQWKAEFSTRDPALNPQLKSLRLESAFLQEETSPLRQVRGQNHRIQGASYEFADEDYQSEILQQLRRRCELQVSLDTRTPHFSAFMACVDRGSWQECPQSFSWSLHPGLNLLEVRSRNNAGVEGIISTATLEV